MDGMVVFQIITTIIGVGVPVGSILYNAGKFGQRIKTLEDGHRECKEARETSEGCIFDRLSRAEQDLAYHRGRSNGGRA